MSIPALSLPASGHPPVARAVLKLAELGAIHLVTPLVLEELESALRPKAPDALVWLALLLDRIDLQRVRASAPPAVESSRRLINHPGDARMLASA